MRSPDTGKAEPMHVRKRQIVLKLFKLYKAAVQNLTRVIMQFIFVSVHNIIGNFNTQNVSNIALAAFVAP